MDISCIISSGDLELYVLGMLTQEENEIIAQLAVLFPEIRKEIEDIEQSLIHVADDADTASPSASVKTELFQKLNALSKEEVYSKAENASQANEPILVPKEEAKVIPLHKPKPNNGLLVASIVGLLLCCGFIAYLVATTGNYRDDNAALQSKVSQLQQDIALQQQQVSVYKENLSFYQDPVYLKVDLTSVEGKPNALVELFWNTKTHDVYAKDISLPKPPQGKQYQLWAIVDGKPVSGGLLTDKPTPQQMTAFEKADAFAITLEQAGGSETPTLTEMYVMGKPS